MYPQEEAEKRLIDAANHVKELGYQPVYIALHGSQNYGLDTPQSDFDFQCIILPTLDDLICERSVSTTLVYNGGLIEVKDIRQHIKSTIKMNPTYLETFLTPYALLVGECPQIQQIKETLPELMIERRLTFMEALRGIFMRYYGMSGAQAWNGNDKTTDYKPKAAYECARMYYMMRYFMSTSEFLMVPGAYRELIYQIKTHVIEPETVFCLLNTWHVSIDEMMQDVRIRYEHPGFNAGNRVRNLGNEAIKQYIQTEIKQKMQEVTHESCD